MYVAEPKWIWYFLHGERGYIPQTKKYIVKFRYTYYLYCFFLVLFIPLIYMLIQINFTVRWRVSFTRQTNLVIIFTRAQIMSYNLQTEIRKESENKTVKKK